MTGTIEPVQRQTVLSTIQTMVYRTIDSASRHFEWQSHYSQHLFHLDVNNEHVDGSAVMMSVDPHDGSCCHPGMCVIS